jgi:mannose-6-phosphate isomerase-like protein (cupin superfamily)
MPVVHGDQRPIRQTSAGMQRQFLVNRFTGSSTVSVVPEELQPNSGVKAHKHEHEEVFIFLEGFGEAELADEKVQIRPGTALIIPANTFHSFRNTGDVPLRMIGIYASPDYTGPGNPPCPPEDACPVVDNRPLACVRR